MVDLAGDAREAREAERIFPPAAAPDALLASRLASTTREVWELRLALLVALAAALGAQLAATYAAFGSFEPWPAALGAALALLALAVGLVHIQGLSRERTRARLLEAMDETLRTPRDIAGTARAAASRIVELGLADAAIVAVAREEEAGEPALAPLAAAGYPAGWLEEATPRPLAVPSTPQAAERIETRGDRWVSPLEPALGDRPWVARVPVVRDGATLGLLLLVARRRGALGDGAALSASGARLAAALDFASLYEAAFERATTLEAQDARRREFLYAIAHELRSPLTSIQTFAELLAREQQTLDSASELLLSSLSRGVDRLGGFVDDLLELGRVEETEVRLVLGEVDVGEALRAAEGMLRPSFMEREQALALELPEEPLRARARAGAAEPALEREPLHPRGGLGHRARQPHRGSRPHRGRRLRAGHRSGGSGADLPAILPGAARWRAGGAGLRPRTGRRAPADRAAGRPDLGGGRARAGQPLLHRARGARGGECGRRGVGTSRGLRAGVAG